MVLQYFIQVQSESLIESCYFGVNAMRLTPMLSSTQSFHFESYTCALFPCGGLTLTFAIFLLLFSISYFIYNSIWHWLNISHAHTSTDQTSSFTFCIFEANLRVIVKSHSVFLQTLLSLTIRVCSHSFSFQKWFRGGIEPATSQRKRSLITDQNLSRHIKSIESTQPNHN